MTDLVALATALAAQEVDDDLGLLAAADLLAESDDPVRRRASEVVRAAVAGWRRMAADRLAPGGFRRHTRRTPYDRCYRLLESPAADCLRLAQAFAAARVFAAADGRVDLLVGDSVLTCKTAAEVTRSLRVRRLAASGLADLVRGELQTAASLFPPVAYGVTLRLGRAAAAVPGWFDPAAADVLVRLARVGRGDGELARALDRLFGFNAPPDL